MNGLKIYSTAPNGNEAADMADAHYMNLAISQINAESARIKTTDDPIQIMLAHIDILLHLSQKFVEGAHLSIKVTDVDEWKNTFYAWYERSRENIPAKFRDGIKQSADDLFAQLELIAR